MAARENGNEPSNHTPSGRVPVLSNDNAKIDWFLQQIKMTAFFKRRTGANQVFRLKILVGTLAKSTGEILWMLGEFLWIQGEISPIFRFLEFHSPRIHRISPCNHRNLPNIHRNSHNFFEMDLEFLNIFDPKTCLVLFFLHFTRIYLEFTGIYPKLTDPFKMFLNF